MRKNRGITMENLKIAYARRHFEALEVDYDVATSAEEFRQKVLEEHHKSATNFTS